LEASSDGIGEILIFAIDGGQLAPDEAANALVVVDTDKRRVANRIPPARHRGHA
jgi:hypothetical protein